VRKGVREDRCLICAPLLQAFRGEGRSLLSQAASALTVFPGSRLSAPRPILNSLSFQVLSEIVGTVTVLKSYPASALMTPYSSFFASNPIPGMSGSLT
jgi:hypothetical protein